MEKGYPRKGCDYPTRYNLIKMLTIIFNSVYTIYTIRYIHINQHKLYQLRFFNLVRIITAYNYSEEVLYRCI